MARAPRYKVYDDEGDYLASVKDPVMGLAIIAGVGSDGWSIRDGHARVIWLEGSELIPATESYDVALDIIETREVGA